MSVQTDIEARTAKLQGILTEANAALVAKEGTGAEDLSGLPAAIQALPDSGGLELPEEYQAYLDAAAAYYLGEYEHFFIAESEDFVTVGFLTANFTVTGYDVAAGDFSSYGWYSYKYTKASGTWEGTDYTSEESPGYNYTKNIKYADCYVTYSGMVLWPTGVDAYPATTSINYANWDGGSFTETLETGDTLRYTVEFNSDGQPNKITAPDGTVTWIAWEASE